MKILFYELVGGLKGIGKNTETFRLAEKNYMKSIKNEYKI